MTEHPDILPPPMPWHADEYLGSEGHYAYWRFGDDVKVSQAGGVPTYHCLYRLWHKDYAWRRMYGDLQNKRRSTMAPEQYPSSWQSED